MAFQPIRRHAGGDSGKKWFAIVVGVIMLMSVIGFVFSFNPSAQGASFKYGGLTFRQTQQGTYLSEMSGKPVEFFYQPEDVSDIEVPDAAVERLTGSRAAYITYAWNSTLAEGMALLQFDAATILDFRQGVFVQPAFTAPNPFNASVVGCSKATSFTPVLLIQEANNTAIALDSGNQNCVVLNASSDSGFLRAADRLKYALISGAGK
ncbi:hypothetical protein HYU17_06040 [Candidatus Woesearchaeota archaeon]|nr:hypothetical protein [Candidatus Woesearchaeota archaeon]